MCTVTQPRQLPLPAPAWPLPLAPMPLQELAASGRIQAHGARADTNTTMACPHAHTPSEAWRSAATLGYAPRQGAGPFNNTNKHPIMTDRHRQEEAV